MDMLLINSISNSTLSAMIVDQINTIAETCDHQNLQQ
jgi:hypothetical protein